MGDPMRDVVLASGWLSAGVAGWLVLGLLTASVARSRRSIGSLARTTLRLGYPAALRAALIALAGGAITAGSLTASASASQRPGPAPAAASVPVAGSLAWPIRAPAAPVPSMRRPPMVVRPGDTLWSIARASLQHRPGPVTAALVAASWPRWWAANRAVIGPDPDVLRPGERLVAPTPERSSP